MKRLCILLILLLLSGCDVTLPEDNYWNNEKEVLCNKVAHQAARQIYQETNLIPCGSGGQAMDQVKMLALAFDCRRLLTITSARILLVKAVDTFAKVVNNEEKIRPYLGNYPFEPKNIEIRIFIQKPDGSDFGEGQLTVASFTDGTLNYKISSSHLVTIHSESYAEAVAKLRLSVAE